MLVYLVFVRYSVLPQNRPKVVTTTILTTGPVGRAKTCEREPRDRPRFRSHDMIFP